MRRSIRTFRFDRIQRAIDVETGEVINDLQAWLKQAYESSPACALRKLFYDSYDVIRTLLYLSKADGRFTKPEKEVMLDYCRQQTGNVVIDLKAMEKALHDIDTPSKQAFKLACNNIAKGSSATRKSIYELVTSLVAADGRLDPDELSALEYLRKKLSVETEVKLIPA